MSIRIEGIQFASGADATDTNIYKTFNLPYPMLISAVSILIENTTDISKEMVYITNYDINSITTVASKTQSSIGIEGNLLVFGIKI